MPNKHCVRNTIQNIHNYSRQCHPIDPCLPNDSKFGRHIAECCWIFPTVKNSYTFFIVKQCHQPNLVLKQTSIQVLKKAVKKMITKHYPDQISFKRQFASWLEQNYSFQSLNIPVINAHFTDVYSFRDQNASQQDTNSNSSSQNSNSNASSSPSPVIHVSTQPQSSDVDIVDSSDCSSSLSPIIATTTASQHNSHLIPPPRPNVSSDSQSSSSPIIATTTASQENSHLIPPLRSQTISGYVNSRKRTRPERVNEANGPPTKVQRISNSNDSYDDQLINDATKFRSYNNTNFNQYYNTPLHTGTIIDYYYSMFLNLSLICGTADCTRQYWMYVINRKDISISLKFNKP